MKTETTKKIQDHDRIVEQEIGHETGASVSKSTNGKSDQINGMGGVATASLSKEAGPLIDGVLAQIPPMQWPTNQQVQSMPRAWRLRLASAYIRSMINGSPPHQD